MEIKFLLPMALATVSMATYAEGDSRNSLSYRVPEKEIYYNLGMEIGTSKQDISSVSSTLTGQNATDNTTHDSFETKKSRLMNDLTYGINDTFSIGLGLDLSLANNTTIATESLGVSARSGSVGAKSGTSTFNANEVKNNGLENLRLNSSYRYLTGDLKADFLVGLTFSGKSKEGSLITNLSNTTYSSSSGDAMLGGSSLKLATRFASSFSAAFEWAAAVGVDYKMEKKVTVVGGDANTSAIIDYEKVIQSNMDFNVNLASQYNFTPSFALGASLNIKLVPQETSNATKFASLATQSVPFTSIDESHTDFKLGINGKYQLMANVDLGLGFSHLIGGDIDGTQATGASITKINKTNRKDDLFGFNFAVRL